MSPTDLFILFSGHNLGTLSHFQDNSHLSLSHFWLKWGSSILKYDTKKRFNLTGPLGMSIASLNNTQIFTERTTFDANQSGGNDRVCLYPSSETDNGKRLVEIMNKFISGKNFRFYSDLTVLRQLIDGTATRLPYTGIDQVISVIPVGIQDETAGIFFQLAGVGIKIP